MARLPKLTVRFFRSDAGNEPVREWLKALSASDRKVIGDDIRTLQFGWPVGMPLTRPLGHGLHEVRSNLEGNRIARVIFCCGARRGSPFARFHQEKPENVQNRY